MPLRLSRPRRHGFDAWWLLVPACVFCAAVAAVFLVGLLDEPPAASVPSAIETASAPRA